VLVSISHMGFETLLFTCFDRASGSISYQKNEETVGT
jgi:hypothetical protein